MTRILRLVLAGIAIALSGGGAATAMAEFLSGFEDIPVMAGLAPLEGADMVFDTPEGRLVESYASGAVTRAAVRRFYAATLPQLGWTAVSETVFRREGESLTIEFIGPDGDLTVRFRLSPAQRQRGQER